MELEIEDKLQEKYEHIIIEVNYLDLRKYQINVKIKIENQEYKKRNNTYMGRTLYKRCKHRYNM